MGTLREWRNVLERLGSRHKFSHSEMMDLLEAGEHEVDHARLRTPQVETINQQRAKLGLKPVPNGDIEP